MSLHLTAITTQTRLHRTATTAQTNILTAITATDTGLDATVTDTKRKKQTSTSTVAAACMDAFGKPNSPSFHTFLVYFSNFHAFVAVLIVKRPQPTSNPKQTQKQKHNIPHNPQVDDVLRTHFLLLLLEKTNKTVTEKVTIVQQHKFSKLKQAKPQPHQTKQQSQS
jgi:hypothetical protein